MSAIVASRGAPLAHSLAHSLALIVFNCALNTPVKEKNCSRSRSSLSLARVRTTASTSSSSGPTLTTCRSMESAARVTHCALVRMLPALRSSKAAHWPMFAPCLKGVSSACFCRWCLATWPVSCKQPYRMFRIVSTGPNSNNNEYLALSGHKSMRIPRTAIRPVVVTTSVCVFRTV